MTNIPIAAKLAEIADELRHYAAQEIDQWDPLDLAELASRIDEALAEYDTAKDSPAWQPVAWMRTEKMHAKVAGNLITKSKIFLDDIPLYTQPPTSAPEAQEG